MELSKATWTTTGEDVFNLAMSISKVDKDKRIVFGWATLDNPDSQDDVVTFEASQRAFAKFRGNLREMHQQIAAGRMIDYRPQVYRDEETGEIHNGIFVAAYVSEGAESTWKKVLDGTLSAFSINGKVLKARNVFDNNVGRVLRYVDDYQMNELSLVDAGGNPLTNLVSIVKSATGEVTVEGELAEVDAQNVFMCKEDGIVEMSSGDSLVCQKGHDMKNIGWVEANTDQTMVKVNALVKEYVDNDLSKTVEGGVDGMAEEKNSEETVVETVKVEETAKVDEAAPVDEAVVADEAKADEPEKAAEETVGGEPQESAADSLEKALEAALTELREHSGATKESLEQLMKDVNGKMDAFEEEMNKRFTALEEKQENLSKSLESVVGDLGNMTKSVTGLQEASATRKSGDLGGEPEGDVLSKSVKPGIWQGAIL